MMRGLILHTALAAAFLAAPSTASAAPARPASGEQCYPGTAAEPLEDEVVVDGSGGTFWEIFKEKVAKPFEAKCGVRVTLTVTPGRPLSQVFDYVRRNQVPWDISFFNKPWELREGIAQNAYERFPPGFWDPIKDQLLPNSYSDYGTWLSSYSNVLIYNPKVFPEGMRSWADFWDTARFPGPRTMQNNPLNIIAALLADGVTNEQMYPITDDKLRRAFAKLNELRPSISSFWTATDQPIQGVHRGDFVAGIVYSGRANAGILRGYDIAINWNQNIFDVAWFFRPRGSRHPRAGAALLYFLNQFPEVSAELAKQTGYSYANRNMERFLSPEQAGALATSHRDQAAVVDTEWWAENGPRVTRLWNEWVASGKMPL